MTYEEFILSKKIKDIPTGIPHGIELKLNPMLFDFQHDCVVWAIRRGRACIWGDCGTGKTPMQLEWGKHVCDYTKGNTLIVTTLAVTEQTALDEAPKFGIQAKICESQKDVVPGINVTNYEKLDKFDLSQFSGLVLDESSILKNFSGVIRNKIIQNATTIPFRLACTATPAPNDFMELGNHAEFVGAMKYHEMLSMFFVHDGGDTAKWRLKGHAKKDFFEWVASWAVMFRKPSDLGYSDEHFKLPELRIHTVSIHTEAVGDNLFPVSANTLHERQEARRNTITERAEKTVEIINKNGSEDSWCVWCNLNQEANEVTRLLDGSVNVQGSDSNEQKTKAMLDFAHGILKRIVTKPKIAGMGVNWQVCHKVVFLGLSDSFEQYYQAIRRFWRHGQEYPVDVWIVTADIEGNVVENILRKEKEADELYSEMIRNMCLTNRKNISGRNTGNIAGTGKVFICPAFLNTTRKAVNQ